VAFQGHRRPSPSVAGHGVEVFSGGCCCERAEGLLAEFQRGLRSRRLKTWSGTEVSTLIIGGAFPREEELSGNIKRRPMGPLERSERRAFLPVGNRGVL